MIRPRLGTSRRPGGRAWSLAAPLLAVLVALGACTDAPTSPVLAAWLEQSGPLAAVLPPQELPTTSTWLVGRAASPQGARLEALQRAADLSLARGHVGAAARLRSEAGALDALSLGPEPDARLLTRTSDAVDLWLTRVERMLEGSPSRSAEALLGPVAEGHAAAATALEAGDSVAAARSLVRSAEEIRAVAPRLAVLRVVEGAEARVEGLTAGSPEADRARHLARTARLALEADDAVLALRRAVYATQLAGGQQLVE